MSHADRTLIDQFLEATSHLSAREAAQEIGMSHQTVARWKKGDGQRLTKEARRALSRALSQRGLVESRAEAGEGKPIFVVSNHHVEACGSPPVIDGDTPMHYHSYFENQYGEQLIFIYDHARGEGMMRMGDAGWEEGYRVVEGFAEVVMGPEEILWLVASWAAATGQHTLQVLEAHHKKSLQRQMRGIQQALVSGSDPQ